MTRGWAAVLLGWSALGAALPLAGADKAEEKGPKQSFEVTQTRRVPFQPGGTIRLENSYGYLSVEGWDEPEVELTVIHSTDRLYEPEEKEKQEQRFEEVRVESERRSDQEFAIETSLPRRKNLLSGMLPERRVIVTLPVRSHRGVTLEYRLRVPRDSRLVVHHDFGYVSVSDVTGDIEVRSHTGDMIVMLPDPGPYAVDARTGMGSVSSDLAGRGRKRFLVATRFTHASGAPARMVRLRMGRGNITIKTGPASAASGSN